MATLGPEPRPHSQLPSAALQANLSGLGSSTNLPLNRGLERALEDAASSGFLNLSTRKLKEFPRTASNYDLTDTVEADLSKNRLIDIPSEVCHLVSLETLNLYHNCIKSIPDTTISLQSLTYLNISCVVYDGQFSFVTIYKVDVADLPLVKFDFSCNKVSTIPVCYRKMTQLQSLQLENNPLQSPPAQICMKGKIHVFKYLAMEACRSDKMADALYLPVTDRLSLTRPMNGSTEDIDQHKKLDSDSGVGSDNGDKRLSATEPSDEDSFSLNVPMTNITEEEGLSKDDSSEHISALTADRSSSESLKEQLGYRDSTLSSPFISYIKGRGADFDEPLRIEEDTNWASVQTSKVNMINQLKEAVEMLQDPNRVNMNSDLSSIKLYPVEMVTVDESLNGQESVECQATPKGRVLDFDEPLRIEEDTNWASARQTSKCHMINQLKEAVEMLQDPNRFSPPPHSVSVFCLVAKRVSSVRQHPKAAPGECWEFQRKRQYILERARLEAQLACQQYALHMAQQGDVIDQEGSDDCCENQVTKSEDTTPVSSPTLSSPPFGLKPRSEFRMFIVICVTVFFRTHKTLESVDPQFTMRRKMEQLREELELIEQLREPKLSMAKCRRNVENFLDACREMGVPESSLCSAYDVLQFNLRPLWAVVAALLMVESTGTRQKEGKVESGREKETEVKKLIPESTQTPPPSWQIWDLIGSSLLHVFCLVMLFVAYSWSEFK
ncbi:hypothetical protein cypCar_00015287 [Cyprinus carpio]|nr:hypothetical protein cypCar_00015287 [Cyprinus carpio]